MARWDGLTPLGLLPDRICERHAQRPALVFEGQRISFAQLLDDIDRTAKALLALGVKPGDKCLVWLMNSPQWIHLMFAIAKIGAVQVPINTRLRADDFAFVLGQSNAAYVFTHDRSGPIDYGLMLHELVGDAGGLALPNAKFPDLREVVLLTHAHNPGAHSWPQFLALGEAIADAALTNRAGQVGVDDTLFIMYTSGTTGFPKGVMRNHRLIGNECDRLDVLGTNEFDVVINYLPLFHIFGYVDGPLSSVLTGNCQVLLPTFDAEQALRLVEQEGGTQIQGFEAHLNELVRAQRVLGADLHTLRCGVFAAGMQSGAGITRDAWNVLAPLKTITAYGMTEIGANCSLSRQHSSVEQASESSGLPCPGYDFRIVDPLTQTDCSVGTAGEVWIKTDNIMQGYYGEPVLTAAAFSKDGWFKSGDMGYLRPDGYFRFLGRYKDMLKIGGENVDPMEVERYLLTHEAVTEAAVVGYADEKLTQIPVAFVCAAPGTSTQALIDYCHGRLASFKVPRHIWVVDALPMTSSGKVRKVELREAASTRLT